MPVHDAVLGLEPGSNRLRPYTPHWAELYAVEARAIRAALGSLALDVQHVGSTAVPGIMAKPILDIAIGVRRLDQFPQCIAPLANLGYQHAHWAGLERDEVFGKGVNRTHLIHIVEFEGDKWHEYIRFRDRLRRGPALSQEYEQLKITLSQLHATNRAEYTAAKHSFIRGVLDAA